MSERLGLEHVSLVPSGPTLSLSMAAGQCLAVAGPGGSGKSRLLRALAGLERPAQGTVRTQGRAAYAAPGGLSRRIRPQNLARKGGEAGNAAQATELLLATRLWEVRQETVGELTPSQVAACELIEPLISGAELILIDGQLDALDPWTLATVNQKMRDLSGKGVTFVFATNRPELVRTADAVVVLKEQQVRFAGGIPDLLRVGPRHALHVATKDQAGVRGLVAPFEVSIEETPDGLVMRAREGQELAARLLLEGYGDVRFVVVQPPTVEEALLSLM
jgi:ABC-type lipoprotein export system ATPase subunit